MSNEWTKIIDEKIIPAELIGSAKDGHRGNVAAKSTAKKRRLSPEARARIAAAQNARWAKAKKAAR